MGRLAGIARHDRPKGAMEVRDSAEIVFGEGVRGNFRGALKPGHNKREVTLMAIEDWQQAAEEVGKPWLDWFERRANLLTQGVTLPHTPGARIRVGDGALLEVTGETEPCERMEAIAPGLRAALTPHWRGGVTMRVTSGGPIRIGDAVECEE